MSGSKNKRSAILSGSRSASFNSRNMKLESLFRFSASMHHGASSKRCKINIRHVLNMIGELKYGETVPAMMMIDLGSLNGTINVKCNGVDEVASI